MVSCGVIGGDIEVYDAEGKLLRAADNLVLCRCGHSGDKPFCDGSHKKTGFQHDGCFQDDRTEALTGEGKLAMTVRANAMLIAKGPMTLLSADGNCVSTRNKAALCRCGHSDNKPFCDASHKRCGFVDD